MKKKFETSDIEQYFHRTNNIAPIYDEEKVHQIITRPAAVARLKGNNNNLLKFTIMTTLFTVIISAVLFWPGESIESSIKNQDTGLEIESSIKTQDTGLEIESSIKNQDTRQVSGSDEVDGSSVSEGSEKSIKGSDKDNNNDENRTMDMAYLNKTTTYAETSNTLVANTEQIAANMQEKIIEPSQQSVQKPNDFDPSAIEPTNGSSFYVEANREMLEEIGFQFSDSAVYYQNLTPDKKKVSYILQKEKSGDCTIIRTSKLNNLGFLKSVSFTQNSFYPVIETRLSGNIVTTNLQEPFDFEFVNDTLFPLVIKSELLLGFDVNDVVLWFTATDDLLKIVGKKELIPIYRNIKNMKKEMPQVNHIDYTTSFTEGINLIDLSLSELLQIGFTSNKEQLTYKNNNGTVVFWVKINSWITGNKEKTSALRFVTNDQGDLYFRKEDHDSLNINNLIPVIIHKDSLTGILNSDLICWFSPSDSFFDALPHRIGNDLRKEYHYITATDKSTLIKPECKYFEECKNTLDISNFKVYPNPAKDQATVSFTLPEAIGGRIILVDLSGRERQVLQPDIYFSAGSHRFDFDLSTVVEGIYLITLYSNKGVQTQRLMVVR